MRRLLALSLLLAAPVYAQSSALQYGRAQPITAQERQQGAQANQGLIQEYGGALTGRQAAYVEQIGQRIATQSGLSNSPGAFNVTLLNSPVNNAFAIPGGYVYVTRDLVALMNDEAELAAVMGHEVAHVAARHSRSRQTRAQRNSILGALGQLGLGALFGNSGLGGLAARSVPSLFQLDTLGFSRSQETQSDDLAVRYLASANYDPLALSTMLESLAEQNQLQGALRGEARSLPGWASTHPEPASRIRRAQQQAATVRVATPTRNRDAFLAAIDGMMYGEDPKQGVIEGNSFLHPSLGIAFTVPQGFTMQNGTEAVSIQGSGGQAQFSTAPFQGDLGTYVANVVRGLGGGATGAAPAQRTTVNGIPAAYTQLRAQSGNTPVDVTVFAYQLAPTRAVHFVTLSQAGRGPGALEQTFGSLRRLSSSEAAQIRPRYVRVVTVGSRDTPASLSARMAYPDYRLERFLVLNRLEPNQALRPGDKVKLVTY
ncbi:M48 family metalloprotease [Sphingomonas lenta]|uniref:Peptidase M48 Ste24p n=1 Tax=Sphingomonas lenta TaxID=1141887 RepID=A0A2A2SEQ3_9SPHN|nr:M48 family metalloprotease [Sphingomonas lenta]PAX07680.1 peptidase M48 Ste24p [Sphingomonas lenta]